MVKVWNFIVNNSEEMLSQTGEHLWLTFAALLIAIALGVPTGIIITRYKRSSGSVLGVVGVIQTIPSIALLGFLLPLFGIGATPAIIALFLYALLPIVRNTYSGIDEVENTVIEAARGMGMSNRQILTKVELPLAVPVIFAGIRTATVINVGVATLCALIGAGGLGEFIFRGIALNNVPMILAGAFPAALLALAFDFLLGIVERNINRWAKPLGMLTAAVIIFISGWLVYQNMQEEPFKAGMPTEFIQRADGYQELKKHYDMTMPTLEMNQALMYQALRNKKVDVIGGYSTDGRIAAYNFVVLEDDKNFFPPYSCAPVVNNKTLKKYPEIEDALNKLSGRITNDNMQNMNFEVDQNKKDPAVVARNFLDKKNFKTGTDRTGEPDVIIGGKNFTEQFILGEMLAIMIENYTSLTAGTKLGLAGTKIVFDALRSQEIDIYPEYSGTGLYVWLDKDASVVDSLDASTQKIHRYVKRQSQKRFNITWLKPLGFDNSYALMMRQKQAKKLNIRSISDLARYLRENGTNR